MRLFDVLLDIYIKFYIEYHITQWDGYRYSEIINSIWLKKKKKLHIHYYFILALTAFEPGICRQGFLNVDYWLYYYSTSLL